MYFYGLCGDRTYRNLNLASIFAFGFRFIFTNRLNCVNLENWGLYLEERLYKKIWK